MSASTLLEEENDVYCYKVVYPYGAFIRVSPALHAAKTGETLESGIVFESSKSVFSDGINYVRLDDGRGWVFSSKDNIQVLDLIKVYKKKIDSLNKMQTQTHSESLSNILHIKTDRNQTVYWREIRCKATFCRSFADFSSLCCGGVVHGPPSTSAPGPARSEWMAEASHGDDQVRRCISLIASTTRKGAESVSCTRDLEAHLWVLAHLGGQIGHIMQLVVDEANVYFEKMSPSRRSQLLAVALEVGAATRLHNIELSRHIGILADDLRHFIQRWVIIKSNKPPSNGLLYAPVTAAALSTRAGKVASPRTSSKSSSTRSVSSDGDSERLSRGEAHMSATRQEALSGSSASAQSCENGRLTSHDKITCELAVAHPAGGVSGGGAQTSSWLSSWACSPPAREPTHAAVPAMVTTTKSAGLWVDLDAYVRRLTSDPDWQFAGVI